MDSGLAFEEKAFLSKDRLTVWRKNSAVMMLARQLILALCQERCCFKMSENLLGFGMVCVVVKLTLCYVFQRVLFFCRVRRAYPTEIIEKAVDYLEKCKNISQVARAYDIYRSTLYCWLDLEQKIGKVDRRVAKARLREIWLIYLIIHTDIK